MSTAFADSFYWIALFNPADQWHSVARQNCTNNGISKLVTTDEVLIEFLTQFCKFGPHTRRRAAEFVRSMSKDANLRVLEQSRSSFEAGLLLFESRPDKSYSLTDCISMSTMRDEGITAVLTHDEHFVQEGFDALFRP